MNNYDSAFLGYELRIDPELVRREWERERRLVYLLNPDIDIPLSVDTLCWPTVAEYHSRAESGTGVNADPVIVPASVYHQTVADFLPDLPDTQKTIPGQIRETVVAVKVFSNEPLFNNGFWVDALTVQIVEPDWSTWKLLGFDVADEMRISGLCNCAYKSQELDQLRAWKDKLNAHGLFSEIDGAIAFVDVTNERVEEHAPFYVYGLFTQIR